VGAPRGAPTFNNIWILQKIKQQLNDNDRNTKLQTIAEFPKSSDTVFSVIPVQTGGKRPEGDSDPVISNSYAQDGYPLSRV
jgi:hypothetical protein